MATSNGASDPVFTPGLQPPGGITADPGAPNEMRPIIVIVTATCLCLTGTLLAVRCATRALIMRRWGLEDFLCILSWLLYVAYSAVLLAGLGYGAGQHQYDLWPVQVQKILYFNNIDELTYGFAILIIKITLLYLYLCIFVPVRFGKRWWAIMIVMVLNALFYGGLTFAKAFLCRPRAAIWDKSLEAKCGSLLGVLIASGTWNTGSDLVILSMPVLFVWQLKLSRKKRLMLIGVFAIGAVAPIFSIVGVVMRVRFTKSPDTTYGQWRILAFAYAELTAGHLCTSLPVLPRFYRWLRGQRDASFPAANYYSGEGERDAGRYRLGSSGRRFGRSSIVRRLGATQGLQDKDLLSNTVSYFELCGQPNRHAEDSQDRHTTTSADASAASASTQTQYAGIAETPRRNASALPPQNAVTNIFGGTADSAGVTSDSLDAQAWPLAPNRPLKVHAPNRGRSDEDQSVGQNPIPLRTGVSVVRHHRHAF